MSTTVDAVTSTCTPPVTSAGTSLSKNATAKLLIQSDGRIRLKANSQDFPTPGTKDSHKLYASYNDSGAMNVYYSPTGNTSEVYLLRPKDTAGKEKRDSSGDSVISNLFLKQNTKTGDIPKMPTITVVNDKKGLISVTENKISLLKQSKFNQDEVVSPSKPATPSVGHLKSVVPAAVSSPKGRPKSTTLPKTKVPTFPDKGSRSPSPDPEECLAALPHMDIGKTIAAFLKDTESKNIDLPTNKKCQQETTPTTLNITLPTANLVLQSKVVKPPQNVPMKPVVIYPTASASALTTSLAFAASQKIQSLVTTMKNENVLNSTSTMVKSGATFDSSFVKKKLKSRVSQNDSSTMSIRIDSVFSLADVGNNCGEKEATSKENPSDKATSVKKVPKLGPKSYKVRKQMKESQCKPCFVVLERTSIHQPKRTKKRKANTLQVKCSDHCRKRTLSNLCHLGLLDCKHSKPTDQSSDIKKTAVKVVPAKKVDETCLKVQPKIMKASELFPTNRSCIYPKTDPKNTNRLVCSKFDNNATKATVVKPGIVCTGSKNTTTIPTIPFISKTSQSVSISNSTVTIIPTSQITSQLSNKASSLSLLQCSSQPTSSHAINNQVVVSKSNLLKQQIKGGNNRYILVNVGGKNVLIPAVIQGKSTDNAFVINPNKDGTSVLLPAKITCNKITSGQTTTTNATTTLSKPSTAADNVTLTSPAVSQPAISSKVHPSGLVVMSNNTVPVTNAKVPLSNTKSVNSVPMNNTAQGVTKSVLNDQGSSVLAISQSETSTASAATTVSSSSSNDTTVNSATKKRKKTLAERYPLPPGVVIKKEPVTSGYGDEESDPPPTKKVTKTQEPTLTSKDVTNAICNLISNKKKTSNISNNRGPLNVNISNNRGPLSVNLANNGQFITMKLPDSSAQHIRLLPTRNQSSSLTCKSAAQKSSKTQPVIRIVSSSSVSTPVSSSTPASVVIRTVPPPNVNPNPPSPTVPMAEPTVTFAAPSLSWTESQSFHDVSEEVEEALDPPSPGPPDLGEPQVILASKDSSSSGNDTYSSIDRAEPAATQPNTKSTLKTEKEKRIEKLRLMLREREEALEEMRRKKASEEPIEYEDDF